MHVDVSYWACSSNKETPQAACGVLGLYGVILVSATGIDACRRLVRPAKCGSLGVEGIRGFGSNGHSHWLTRYSLLAIPTL